LKNFKETAIYKDENGERLRVSGNNSMIALFMAMFAKEVFPKFNEVFRTHFEKCDTLPPNFTATNDYKGNVIRIWQKINEYQESTRIK